MLQNKRRERERERERECHKTVTTSQFSGLCFAEVRENRSHVAE